MVFRMHIMLMGRHVTVLAFHILTTICYTYTCKLKLAYIIFEHSEKDDTVQKQAQAI